MTVTPAAPPAVRKRIQLLCVDDEPQVLEGFKLSLGRRYELFIASGGAEALEILGRERGIAVVTSDMRMPGMDGATFLARARAITPEVTRILLTGQADVEAATAAINEGGIFRFLTKPCAPPQLLAAVEAAVEQHRLITSERVLLEQTLLGSIRALNEILALTNPTIFGRSTRVKHIVSELSKELGVKDRWASEIAATLSQLGCVTLPEATLENLYHGRKLSIDEERMVARVPDVTEQLLAHIPRLEPVREILTEWNRHPAYVPIAADGEPMSEVQQGAEMLRVAVDFDTLQAQGTPTPLALDTLRGRAGRYEPTTLAALGRIRGAEAPRQEVFEILANELRLGMVFVDEVRTRTGLLLVVPGFEVTHSLLERIRNDPGNVVEPLRVTTSPAA